MSSQDRLQSLTKQSISLRNNVEELERQRTELEVQLRAVRAESHNKDNELDQEVMVCARAEAREIVQAMYDKLPAELCAYIFSYLIPHDAVEDTSMISAHEVPKYPLPSRLSVMLFPSIVNVQPPVYIAPKGRIYHSNFVSEGVALEAAKLYYRMNTFKVSVTVPQDRLRQLLEVDRFQLGLEPFKLIRRLTLGLEAGCCRWPRTGSRRSRTAPIVGTEELDRLTQHGIELSTNLALIPLENRPTMEFTFMISMTGRDVSPIAHWNNERDFLNMLMCVREIVYDTKNHGSKVTVCAKTQVITSSRSHTTEPVDISTLFPLSVEEWQKESEHPQLDALYIPPDSVELPDNESTESLRAQARQFWGYESFEALLIHPSQERSNRTTNRAR